MAQETEQLNPNANLA